MYKAISQIFETAAKVGNEWSLAAFAIAVLALVAMLAVRKRSLPKNVSYILGAFIVALVILATLPLLSRTYLANRGVYRLRVTVEDPSGAPLNNAKVTSSVGGEPKSVPGGWEFDIPVSSRPQNGKVTIYGQVPSSFLSGKIDVELSSDYNVPVKLPLAHDRSARIHGQIVDRNGFPVVAAKISVVGYGSEAITTGTLGQFDLAAHVSDGQQVQLAAFKKGIGAVSEWKQAGEQPATIILGRK
jgi:hypothetical protein